MQDILFVSATVGFFALTWWLVNFADRLEAGEKPESKA